LYKREATRTILNELVQYTINHATYSRPIATGDEISYRRSEVFLRKEILSSNLEKNEVLAKRPEVLTYPAYGFPNGLSRVFKAYFMDSLQVPDQTIVRIGSLFLFMDLEGYAEKDFVTAHSANFSAGVQVSSSDPPEAPV
jgi:hypothetical protein